MSIDYQWKNVLSTIKVFSIWFVSCLIDGAFLILWVGVQYGTNWVISQFVLSGIDKWVFLTFQVIFAISTLYPVIIHICTDFATLSIRSWRIIQQTRKEELVKIEEQSNRHTSPSRSPSPSNPGASNHDRNVPTTEEKVSEI